ncbi:MAG: adenylate/guanylate cyclase domain-containing protein, partial [Bacteroidota bacterium]
NFLLEIGCMKQFYWVGWMMLFGLLAWNVLPAQSEHPDSTFNGSSTDYLEQLRNLPLDDPKGLAYATEAVRQNEEARDTIRLINSLRALQLRLEALGDTTNSQLAEVRYQSVYAAYGYVSRDYFPNRRNNVPFFSAFSACELLEDPSGQLPLDSILQQARQGKFVINQSDSWKLEAASAYWIRIRIRGEEPDPQEVLLIPNMDHSLWDEVTLYQQDKYGIWQSDTTGQSIDPNHKPVNDWRDFFPLTISPQTDEALFIRLKGFQPMKRPSSIFMSFVPESYVSGFIASSQRNLFIFLGIVISQFVFFVLLYFATKEQVYLPYLLYIGGIILFGISTSRFFFWFPYADNFVFILVGMGFSWLAGLGLYIFSLRFLNVKELLPEWSRISQGFLIIYTLTPILFFVSALISDVIQDYTGTTLEQVLQVILKLYMFLFGAELILLTTICIQSLRKKYRPARYYLVALVLLLGSVGLVSLIPVFNLYFIIEYENAMLLIETGIVLQLCFFALGIGDKRRELEKHKLNAQENLNQELSRVNRAFARFVPMTFLKAIGRERVIDIEIGDGVEEEVTVYFSDMRGYTRLAEQMTPRENFRFLNGYLGRLGPVIREHEGFVNQYYGDGIMAIFMQSPADALLAAIQTQRVLRKYNLERKDKGRQAIRVGLGLHTGSLMMGVIGDSLRMEAGVVSDTVNTASRMEGLTKHFGVNVVCSESVINHPKVKGRFLVRFLGRVQVKGKMDPVGVYDCFEGDAADILSKKEASLPDFEKAISAYYQKDFATAARAFDKVLNAFPEDQVSLHYLAQCKYFLIEGTPADWDGVEALQTK